MDIGTFLTQPGVAAVSAILAFLSLLANLWLVGSARQDSRRRLLFDLMKEWLKYSEDKLYVPAREIIRACDQAVLTDIVDYKAVRLPANLGRHLSTILGRSVEGSSGGDILLDLQDDIAEVRYQLFRTCNWVEAVSTPHRLALVDEADFMSAFKNVFFDENDAFVYNNFVAGRRASLYESCNHLKMRVQDLKR